MMYVVIHGCEYENSWPEGSRAFNTMPEAEAYADDNYRGGHGRFTEIWEYPINSDHNPHVYSRRSDGVWL